MRMNISAWSIRKPLPAILFAFATVFLGALAEHLAAKEDRGAPPWAQSRSLRQFWFPFNTRAARVDALVHAPAAFRRRGVFVAARELEVA